MAGSTAMRFDCSLKRNGFVNRISAPVLLIFVALTLAMPCHAVAAPPLPGQVSVRIAGPAVPVFVAPRDACDGDDVPDAPSRAFRQADGRVRMFGLHTKNRSLTGPDLLHLAIGCHPALLSRGNPDPAAYDDQSWITATWTADGAHVDALIHHEYQGNEHPGRCAFPDYMQCWFNTVLAARSVDGGATFTKTVPAVVASTPFGQETGQGHHRGFFNPSNLFGDGKAVYFMASTTGWSGQPGGVCLFRSLRPSDPAAWRAYDGQDFTIRYADPYRTPGQTVPSCRPIGPFPTPVGSVVRQRSTGQWIAVFQAKADAEAFPVPGFYVAVSADLLHWSAPRLLLAGRTLYDGACDSDGQLIAYPSMLDPSDPSRNFDQSGDAPVLFYTRLETQGCSMAGPRQLLRQPLLLGGAPALRKPPS